MRAELRIIDDLGSGEEFALGCVLDDVEKEASDLLELVNSALDRLTRLRNAPWVVVDYDFDADFASDSGE